MPDEQKEAAPYPWKTSWITWCLVGSTFAVYLCQLWEYHLHGSDVVGKALACDSGAFSGHRYWTLVSYAWAHSVVMPGLENYFWVHISINLAVIFFLGMDLEKHLGHWLFLGLYLGGALAGSLAYLLVGLHPEAGMIGSSAASFALMAAFGTAVQQPVLKLIVALVCGAEVVQYAFAWLPQIAHAAHLGGALFGFIYIIGFRLFLRRTAPPAIYG